MLIAIALAAVGVVLDIRRSTRDKGPIGALGGTLRPTSWAGLAVGLPFYVIALVLLLLAS